MAMPALTVASVDGGEAAGAAARRRASAGSSHAALKAAATAVAPSTAKASAADVSMWPFAAMSRGVQGHAPFVPEA